MGSYTPPPSTSPREPRGINWPKIGVASAIVVALALGIWHAATYEPGRINLVRRASKPRVVYVVPKLSADAIPEPSGPRGEQQKETTAPDPPQAIQTAIMEASVPPSTPPAPATAAPTSPAPKRDETIREAQERCLEFRAYRDIGSPLSSTIPEAPMTPLIVEARNTCDFDLPGYDTWFELAAYSTRGGVLATDRGHFYGTIEARQTAEVKWNLAANDLDVKSYGVRLR